MAADIATSLKDWSTTESSNAPSGTTAISTNLDDNLRMLQKVLRDVYSIGTIASAATCDIGAVDAGILGVTGTTTITSLGTVSAGITKYLVFGGILTLTHNASSLIIPGGANITTAANDIAKVVSLGSGNWRVLSYVKASGLPIAGLTNIPDGTVAAPGLAFTNELSTGLYRVSSNFVGFTINGVQQYNLSTANGFVAPIRTVIGPTGNTLEMSASAGLSVSTTVAVNLSSTGGGPTLTSANTSGSAPIALTCTNGNSINFQAGNVTSGLNQGGSINVLCGDYSGAAASGGGVLTMRAGDSNGFSNGGAVSIRAGNSSNGTGSNKGGNITLTAGATEFVSGIPGNQTGGIISLIGGHSIDPSPAAYSGGIVMKPGIVSGGASPGSIKLQRHTGGNLLLADSDRGTVYFGGSAMTISSGAGSGATIAGNHNTFHLTLGTSPTGVIVLSALATIGSGNTPWPNAPVVMTNYETADINTRASSTTSDITITFASTPAAGGILHVHVFAYE